jgi:hypothetical protein
MITVLHFEKCVMYSELLYFWTLSTQRTGNWICFRPQMRGETPTLLGPLERANRNHWTSGPLKYAGKSRPGFDFLQYYFIEQLLLKDDVQVGWK